MRTRATRFRALCRFGITLSVQISSQWLILSKYFLREYLKHPSTRYTSNVHSTTNHIRPAENRSTSGRQPCKDVDCWATTPGEHRGRGQDGKGLIRAYKGWCA